MALNFGDWDAQRILVDIATAGGAELPMGDMLNLRGIDETPNLGNIQDASSPAYVGSPGAWEFMGGEQGDPYGFMLGRDYYRQQYRQGAADAASRESPAAQAAQIQQQQQEQFRQQQLQNLYALQQRAQGRGPTSAAEASALEQGEAGKRLAQAQALSARGVSGSAAQRAAQETQARAGISAQQQRGLIRQQEQAQAQQALGQLAGQMRGADIGLASSQAGLTQQADLANQQAALEQQALNDQLTQFYTNMGMSLEQAQLQAQVAYEQMLSDIVQSQYQAQAGVITSGLADAARKESAMTGAAGTVAYGVAQAYGGSNKQSGDGG